MSKIFAPIAFSDWFYTEEALKLDNDNQSLDLTQPTIDALISTVGAKDYEKRVFTLQLIKFTATALSELETYISQKAEDFIDLWFKTPCEITEIGNNDIKNFKSKPFLIEEVEHQLFYKSKSFIAEEELDVFYTQGIRDITCKIMLSVSAAFTQNISTKQITFYTLFPSIKLNFFKDLNSSKKLDSGSITLWHRHISDKSKIDFNKDLIKNTTSQSSELVEKLTNIFSTRIQAYCSKNGILPVKNNESQNSNNNNIFF